VESPGQDGPVSDFRHWKHGVFDPESAGRAAIPVRDDTGLLRDFFTGAPVSAPSYFPPEVPDVDKDS
jgi:hypothetical protein